MRTEGCGEGTGSTIIQAEEVYVGDGAAGATRDRAGVRRPSPRTDGEKRPETGRAATYPVPREDPKKVLRWRGKLPDPRGER